MPERKCVAFQNTNSYPISLNIAGIRGKVMLWEGQQIRDREGIPLIPPNSEWPWLISKGVKPVYIETEATPNLPTPEEAPPEIILDDLKLMEQKAASATQNLVAEFLAPKQIVPEEIRAAEESASEPPLNYLERPDNPDPNKGALVWQDKDGVWILNKDGFNSINPAEIKKHVRRDKTLGKDFLDILEWRTFGSKPEPVEEMDDSKVKPVEETPKAKVEDIYQVLNWIIQSYKTDTGGYLVNQRSPADWTVVDPTGTIYDGFIDENSAMAFAESLNYANTNPPAPDGGDDGDGGPPQINPVTIPAK